MEITIWPTRHWVDNGTIWDGFGAAIDQFPFAFGPGHYEIFDGWVDVARGHGTSTIDFWVAYPFICFRNMEDAILFKLRL